MYHEINKSYMQAALKLIQYQYKHNLLCAYVGGEVEMYPPANGSAPSSLASHIL